MSVTEPTVMDYEKEIDGQAQMIRTVELLIDGKTIHKFEQEGCIVLNYDERTGEADNGPYDPNAKDNHFKVLFPEASIHLPEIQIVTTTKDTTK